MNNRPQQIRRLARLKALRSVALHAAEMRLSDANAMALAAEARRELVHELISANSARTGPVSNAMLRGGANLRSLLHAALKDATSRAEEKGHARHDAIRALALAQGRKQRTTNDLAAAVAQGETDADERERADRIPAKRKVKP